MAESSAWTQLRELRNLIIGHPIETGAGESSKRAFVTRDRLESESFDYQVWQPGVEKTFFKHAEHSALYKDYKLEAASHLSEIVSILSRLPDDIRC